MSLVLPQRFDEQHVQRNHTGRASWSCRRTVPNGLSGLVVDTRFNSGNINDERMFAVVTEMLRIRRGKQSIFIKDVRSILARR